MSGATGAQTQQHEQNYAANQAPKAKPKSTPAPKKAASPAPKPKPAAQPSSGKQRQIAQYKSEQAAVDREPSLPVGPGVSLSARDVGEMVGDVMDPRTPLRLPGSTKADRMARAQRIASGQENWQPMVGKTAPGDAQKYRNQRRLAEQQERGIFGERLPKAVAHAKVEQALLTVGSAKLKTGEPLSAMEQKALIDAGKIRNPDPAASDDAATIGTLESMAPQLGGVAEGALGMLAKRGITTGGLASRAAKIGEGIKGRFSRGASADDVEAAAAKTVKKGRGAKTPPPDETTAEPAVKPPKPPKGGDIGTDVPRTVTYDKQGVGRDLKGNVVDRQEPHSPEFQAKVDAEEAARTKSERPPLPKAEEKPPQTRAQKAAQKKRAAEVNAQTNADPVKQAESIAKKAAKKDPKIAAERSKDAQYLKEQRAAQKDAVKKPARKTKTPKGDDTKSSELISQLKESIAEKAAGKGKKELAPEVKAFRRTLTGNYLARFDKMTREQQQAYFEKWSKKK